MGRGNYRLFVAMVAAQFAAVLLGTLLAGLAVSVQLATSQALRVERNPAVWAAVACAVACVHWGAGGGGRPCDVFTPPLAAAALDAGVGGLPFVGSAASIVFTLVRLFSFLLPCVVLLRGWCDDMSLTRNPAALAVLCVGCVLLAFVGPLLRFHIDNIRLQRTTKERLTQHRGGASLPPPQPSGAAAVASALHVAPDGIVAGHVKSPLEQAHGWSMPHTPPPPPPPPPVRSQLLGLPLQEFLARSRQEMSGPSSASHTTHTPQHAALSPPRDAAVGGVEIPGAAGLRDPRDAPRGGGHRHGDVAAGGSLAALRSHVLEPLDVLVTFLAASGGEQQREVGDVHGDARDSHV